MHPRNPVVEGSSPSVSHRHPCLYIVVVTEIVLGSDTKIFVTFFLSKWSVAVTELRGQPHCGERRFHFLGKLSTESTSSGPGATETRFVCLLPKWCTCPHLSQKTVAADTSHTFADSRARTRCTMTELAVLVLCGPSLHQKLLRTLSSLSDLITYSSLVVENGR